jgi:hypothetical protein
MFWGYDWALGLPLLVVTVVAHVAALMLLSIALAHKTDATGRRTKGRFTLEVALSALAAAVLHGLEATV